MSDILKRINLLLNEFEDLSKLNSYGISDLINRDCSKFLKEVNGLELYRGMEGPSFFFKGTVRKDRKPKDMSKKETAIFNKEFEEAHKVKNIRNTSLFTTGELNNVYYYGVAYRIFPIGNYTYWWNPEVVDLFKTYDKDGGVPLLEKLAKGYKNTDLTKAIRSGNEIMFVCDEYYALNRLIKI